MEDRDIIDLYFARDEQAIRRTAEKYGRFCHGIALSILGDEADAEECVNDTYLRTWNSIPPRKPTSLGAFLAKITRNLSIDRYRLRHSARRGGDMDIMLSELGDCLPAPEEERSELSTLLDAFLSDLDPRERRIFMGRYWHAYSVNRLAEAYGMTPNAISIRLHRTREKLREYLTERGYDL